MVMHQVLHCLIDDKLKGKHGDWHVKGPMLECDVPANFTNVSPDL